MTLSPWLIYFADLADSIVGGCAIVTGIALLTIIICIFTWFCNDGDYKSDIKNRLIAKKIGMKAVIIFFISFLLAVFLPSTQTVYKMLIIPPVVNSNVVQKLPDELQQYIDKVLSTKDKL